MYNKITPNYTFCSNSCIYLVPISKKKSQGLNALNLISAVYKTHCSPNFPISLILKHDFFLDNWLISPALIIVPIPFRAPLINLSSKIQVQVVVNITPRTNALEILKEVYLNFNLCKTNKQKTNLEVYNATPTYHHCNMQHKHQSCADTSQHSILCVLEYCVAPADQSVLDGSCRAPPWMSISTG